MNAIATLTAVHVVISLVGILAGFVVMAGLFTSRRLESWTAVFLATTVATSLTGFLFPITRFTPGHAIGILSLILLTAAIVARYPRRLAGAWGPTYAVAAVASQYLNVFVLIVQLFQPALHALAPTGTEMPFIAVQAITLAGFVVYGVVGAMTFRGTRLRSA